VSERIRFHLDEHLPAALADALRKRGIDVTTPNDAGLRGASDEEHLEFAWQSGRVIVTQDNDFLRLHSHGLLHAGITYCKQQTRNIGQIIQALTVIYDSFTPDEVKGQVLYL
jgi:predicted nuclease of predicted toxin-antitoxin system